MMTSTEAVGFATKMLVSAVSTANDNFAKAAEIDDRRDSKEQYRVDSLIKKGEEAQRLAVDRSHIVLALREVAK